MANNNASNVSAAKPKIGGAISRAPLGTSLPESATEELTSAFKKLGYVSEDGLTNSNTFDSTEVASWDGDVVLTAESNKRDAFTFKLLEVLNVDVLKSVYGDDNVDGDLETGIEVRANSTPQEEYSWVVDMIMKNGVLKRIVIPQAKVSAVADIVYKNNEAVGYETTISAAPYALYDGDTHREYIIATQISG
ncbi:MAG: hypothetical protein KBT03_07560 [Bacteroidales bacterium]|nr:hypothetical protein [Candidatus Scybalousia scybalohippi]